MNVHLIYRENGWTQSRCVTSEADAKRLRDAINKLSGPDATERRTWVITRCDCRD